MVLPHKKSIGQKATTRLVFQAYIMVKIDQALHSTKVTECHIALYQKFQFGFTCLSGQLVHVTFGLMFLIFFLIRKKSKVKCDMGILILVNLWHFFAILYF